MIADNIDEELMNTPASISIRRLIVYRRIPIVCAVHRCIAGPPPRLSRVELNLNDFRTREEIHVASRSAGCSRPRSDPSWEN